MQEWILLVRNPSADYVSLKGSGNNLFFQGPGDRDSSTVEKLFIVCPLQSRTDSYPCCYQTRLTGSNGDDKGPKQTEGRWQHLAIRRRVGIIPLIGM